MEVRPEPARHAPLPDCLALNILLDEDALHGESVRASNVLRKVA